MDKQEVFELWAPEASVWSAWAKPVLFAALRANDLPAQLEIPDRRLYMSQAAVIVDLPGEESVAEAMALVDCGFQPVPLFNGTHGGHGALVKVQSLMSALKYAAQEFALRPPRPELLPAFLLDANRMEGGKKKAKPGSYDNRWCVFAQDMPSAAFLLERGIRQIVVRAAELQQDLQNILAAYKAKGLEILIWDGENPPVPAKVHKATRLTGLPRRFGVIVGLKRNAAGGFGAQVPEPMEGGGRIYYGVG